jgi:hypothetical protein
MKSRMDRWYLQRRRLTECLRMERIKAAVMVVRLRVLTASKGLDRVRGGYLFGCKAFEIRIISNRF